MDWNRIKKVLVVKLDHIGDAILATPVFRAIKEQYPNILLDAMVSSNSYPVIQNSPFIRKIYTYDAKQFDRNHVIDDSVIGNNLDTILIIQRENYDLCIGLREDGAMLPIISMLKANLTASFINDTIYYKSLDFYAVQNKKKHASEGNFDLLKLIGIKKPKVLKPEIYVTEDDTSWADNFIRKNKLGEENIIIGVSMGGGWYLNWWPYRNYVDLCKEICQYNKRVKIVFIGGKAEEKNWKDVVKENPDRYVSAMGQTTITQLAALCRRMDFFITNDGGPMHIASTAYKPIIALFGPSPSRRFRPLGDNHIIIDKRYRCSPCPQFEYGRLPSCRDNRCMQAITIEEVYHAAKKLIDKIEKVEKNAQ